MGGSPPWARAGATTIGKAVSTAIGNARHLRPSHKLPVPAARIVSGMRCPWSASNLPIAGPHLESPDPPPSLAKTEAQPIRSMTRKQLNRRRVACDEDGNPAVAEGLPVRAESIVES